MATFKDHLNTQKPSIDLPLAVTVAILVIFGLVMVYDSSATQALRDFGDTNYYIRQQLIWVVLGFVSTVFFIFFNYHKFKKIALLLLLGSLGLLLTVFIPGLGTAAGGAHRWLDLGVLTIQPAEIIKLTSVIYLATLFERQAKILPLLMLIGSVTFIMAVLQKDLGSTIVFVATSLIIYFVSGGPILYFLLTIPLAMLTLLGLIFTSSYRLKRVMAFLDPFSDTQGFTYHISQVLIALGSGGLLGLGLGQSRQKFEYIPEVSTDSIFAIIGEELGFVGTVVVVTLFVSLVIRGFKIALSCQDNFGRILAVGLTSWLAVQSIINLSAMVALLPLTGVPLPFISYGGSALVANLTAIGILLNISKQRS